jgi:predicted acetyltransferase
MTEPNVRVPRDAEERAVFERILQESFGTDDLPWTTWMDRIGHENLRVVEQGGRIRGGLGFYRFGQHWGGKRLALVGLAGVGVAPEARGRGLARRFLVSTLEQARGEGVPLAALYASSVSVYRSVGFEQAGSYLRLAAPIASLPEGDRALACEPFDPKELCDPRSPLVPLYEARARAWSGHLDRTGAIWSRITQPYKGVARGYRFGPASAPEGYVVYVHAPGEDLHFAIALRDLVLATPAAARRCAALLHDLRSLATEVRWLGCASDPLLSLLPEQTARVLEHGRWMLRVLDPERALAQRGYAAEGEARFTVRDPLFGDRGLALRVKAGVADVSRVDPSSTHVTLDVRALAALFSGFAQPSTLRAMGLADGDPQALARTAMLFGGPEPWLCDWF